jgi:hypothetical protein
MIAKWKAKAIVQKTISYLPKKEKINYLFQKYVTKGVFLTDEYFTYKITHACDHIAYFKKYSNKDFSESSFLELGTGWYPIVPIAMYLNDFKEIISIDIQSWMTKESLLTTIEKFIEWRMNGQLKDFLPYINEEKWANLVNIVKENDKLSKDEINQIFHIQTFIQDARNTKFATGYFDFICSNNTFEHVPKAILIPILKEFKRIAKKDGIMSHFVDMSDHFAHFDTTINIYNFLQYSQGKWDSIDNSIQPQNRMRWKDYREIYQDLGIPITDEEVRKGDLKALKSVELAEMYQSYSMEELAISHGYFVSKM